MFSAVSWLSLHTNIQKTKTHFTTPKRINQVNQQQNNNLLIVGSRETPMLLTRSTSYPGCSYLREAIFYLACRSGFKTSTQWLQCTLLTAYNQMTFFYMFILLLIVPCLIVCNIKYHEKLLERYHDVISMVMMHVMHDYLILI